MTRKVLFTVLLVGLLASVSNFAQAQVRFGGGLAYGFDAEEAGITVNALVGLSDQFDLQPSFIYYFAGEGVTFWELNADAHYTFSSAGPVNLYAIGGLQLAYIGFDVFGISANDTDLGVNLGVGATFAPGAAISPFAELKYTVSGFEQLAISGGIRF